MLAMSPNLMGGMSDAHLISALEAEGPLTPAEIELSNRLQEAIAREEAVEGFLALSEEYEFSSDDLRHLIESHPAGFSVMAEMLQLLNDQEVLDLAALSDLLR